mmetsp:Transcript_49170/g.72099  ORF Transcript_49170/g.72099 Transcript_49170/m.72099 type:complete len:89 (+) Transcript_49170:942-1208(+)
MFVRVNIYMCVRARARVCVYAYVCVCEPCVCVCVCVPPPCMRICLINKRTHFCKYTHTHTTRTMATNLTNNTKCDYLFNTSWGNLQKI